MNPVFKGILEDREQGTYIKFTLPATPYEIQDGMERLGSRELEALRFELTEYHDYQYLEQYISPTAEGEELQKLNFLAKRLGELDDWQKASFEGMVRMEMYQREEISLDRLIDLSYSTGSCHVLPEVKKGMELGKFCVQGGYKFDLETLPNEVIKYLDYERIGREHRIEENGVFTEGGYVEQETGIREVSAEMNFRFYKPEYVILMEIGDERYSLPMAEEALQQAYEEKWDRECQCIDCAVPSLIGVINDSGVEIEEINQFAGMLEEVEKQGHLQVYKAVLQATNCHNIEQAEELGSNLEEEYVLFHEKGNPIEIAREWLSEQYAEDIDLFSEEDLYHIGQRYMEKYPTVPTEYGYLQRYDLEPIQPLDEGPETEIGPQL